MKYAETLLYLILVYCSWFVFALSTHLELTQRTKGDRDSVGPFFVHCLALSDNNTTTQGEGISYQVYGLLSGLRIKRSELT